jgi:hypothetical protein
MRAVLLLSAVLCIGAMLPGQSSFDLAAAAFDRAWRAGDADAIAGMLAPEGIRLQLGNESHSQVAGRQARAAISGFLGARAAGRVEMRRAEEAGGEPPKGSAEFRWQTVVQGTSEPVLYTLFVELTRGENRWRISAIRVF